MSSHARSFRRSLRNVAAAEAARFNMEHDPVGMSRCAHCEGLEDNDDMSLFTFIVFGGRRPERRWQLVCSTCRWGAYAPERDFSFDPTNLAYHDRYDDLYDDLYDGAYYKYEDWIYDGFQRVDWTGFWTLAANPNFPLGIARPA